MTMARDQNILEQVTTLLMVVNPGEDIYSKFTSFAPERGVCILSATGSISTVTLQQQAHFGRTIIYEGHFEILSMDGICSPSENNGASRTRTGHLKVVLAGRDNGVIVGGAAGPLIAASTVQLVIGSFVPENTHEANLPNDVVPQSAPQQIIR